MTTKAPLALAVVLLGGCSQLVDPCAGQKGTCLALYVDSTPAPLDALAIHVHGDGPPTVDVEKQSTAPGGRSFGAPIATAILLGDDTLRASGATAFTLGVVGMAKGDVVASGGATASIARGQHGVVHVQLSVGGGGHDLGIGGDGGGGDMSGNGNGDGGDGGNGGCASGYSPVDGGCVVDPVLSSLVVSAGMLEPVFDPNVTRYQVMLPTATTQLNLTATLPDPAQATLTVGGVLVASGTPSPAQTLALGSNDVHVIVTASDGARRDYHLVIVRGLAAGAYFKASDNAAAAYFGYAVAASGDTLVVGAYGESSDVGGINVTPSGTSTSSGAVYVFVRSGAGSGWTQQAFIKASNHTAGAAFGVSVAIDGDTIAVGADGESTGGSGSGAAYVYVRSGTTWSEQAILKAGNVAAGASFGGSIAVSGDTIVVGAPQESSASNGINSTPGGTSTNSGAAYIFARNGSSWTQSAYVKASLPTAGDKLGSSVGVSGTIVAVGAPKQASSVSGINMPVQGTATASGAVYTFALTGGNWTQAAFIKASNNAADFNLGTSVAVDGSTVAAGAFGETTGGTYSGAVYVYVVDGGGTWSEQARIKVNNVAANQYVGTSVAIRGDVIVTGAVGESSAVSGVNQTPSGSALNSGAAYVFTRAGSTWTQQWYLKASNNTAQDEFGQGVGLGSDAIIVGADNESSAVSGIGMTPMGTATDSGAAYGFDYAP